MLRYHMPRGSLRWRHRHARFLPAVEMLEDRSLLTAGVGIHLLATPPNDPSFGSQWDMTKIQAPAAWDTTQGSLKVIVADIDSGIDYTHQDLYLNVWINQGEIPAAQRANMPVLDADGDGMITFWDLNSASVKAAWGAPGTIADSNGDNRIDARDLLAEWDDSADTDGNGYIDDLVGWNFVANNNNPFDDNGHGTHTAGTIGAVGNNGVGISGVNWQVQIMALKVLDSSGNGDLHDATDAIYYSAANGAKVSNNSWGFSDNRETFTGTRYNYLYTAIKNTPKVLFVAAAGNSGLNNDTHKLRNYPASYDLSNIISVAATNSTDGKPSFSNYGATTVDLGAPGQNILSTLPGNTYGLGSGTSMATPHVTGAAALLLAKNLSLTTAELKAAIVGNVDVVWSMTNTASKGRLNVNKALASVSASAPTATSSSAATPTDSSTSDPTPPHGRHQWRMWRQSIVPIDVTAHRASPVLPAMPLLSIEFTSPWSEANQFPSPPIAAIPSLRVITPALFTQGANPTTGNADESLLEFSLDGPEASDDGLLRGPFLRVDPPADARFPRPRTTQITGRDDGNPSIAGDPQIVGPACHSIMAPLSVDNSEGTDEHSDASSQNRFMGFSVKVLSLAAALACLAQGIFLARTRDESNLDDAKDLYATTR